MIRTIYKCDMCGKEDEFYDHPNANTAANYGWWIITRMASRMTTDFCSERCARTFVRNTDKPKSENTQ